MLNSLSIWRVPASSFKLTKIRIDEAYIHKKTDKELHIACLYNIPSYRCGIFGYLFNSLLYRFPNTYVISHYFESMRWTTDVQIICRSISYINRFIPILNFGTWNTKKNFMSYNKENSIFHYGADNDESMSSMLNSFYTPFYDSGCAILSNTPPTSKHFIPFTHHSNRGILYAFYESFNVLVLTISTNQITIEQIQKLISIHSSLTTQYPSATIYIIADFKIEIANNEDIMKLLLPLYKIQAIDDGLSKTTYLLHNYISDMKQIEKILKPNTVMPSPSSPLTKHNRTNDCIETTMEEEKRLYIIREEGAVPTSTTTPPPPPSPVNQTSSDIPSSSSFPYIIFNYFSSNKTPPSSSPITQTPAQSPKSDGSWSKV